MRCNLENVLDWIREAPVVYVGLQIVESDRQYIQVSNAEAIDAFLRHRKENPDILEMDCRIMRDSDNSVWIN